MFGILKLKVTSLKQIKHKDGFDMFQVDQHLTSVVRFSSLENGECEFNNALFQLNKSYVYRWFWKGGYRTHTFYHIVI